MCSAALTQQCCTLGKNQFVCWGNAQTQRKVANKETASKQAAFTDTCWHLLARSMCHASGLSTQTNIINGLKCCVIRSCYGAFGECSPKQCPPTAQLAEFQHAFPFLSEWLAVQAECSYWCPGGFLNKSIWMVFCFLRQDGFATKDNKTIIHHGGRDSSLKFYGGSRCSFVSMSCLQPWPMKA